MLAIEQKKFERLDDWYGYGNYRILQTIDSSSSGPLFIIAAGETIQIARIHPVADTLEPEVLKSVFYDSDENSINVGAMVEIVGALSKLI